MLEELVGADVFVGWHFTSAMAHRAQKLRFIQVSGAGCDGIAFEALARGVVVANTYGHERAIAEYVVMAMIALSRRLLENHDSMRRGMWASIFSSPLGWPHHEISGRTVGLLGFGHVGREVARLLRSFGTRVMALDPYLEKDRLDTYGLDRVCGPNDIEVLFSESDFLVLALPLTPETTGLVDGRLLSLMRRDSFLINVARGPIVQEDALFEALSSGRLAGAALDVWYSYPEQGKESQVHPSRYPFHSLANVIMTPHCSGRTEETTFRRIETIAENLRRFAKGEQLLNVLPVR
jgi:phosphoglycerate dehydrogenase-like enzyme